MKTIKKLSVIVAAVCLMATTISCEKGRVFGISGKGEVVSKSIEIENISGVELSISGDVILTQGDYQEIRIEAQKNIIENIKTRVRNGMWDIDFDKNVHNHKDVKIYITVPNINEIALSGSGSITSNSTFTPSNLEISVSGSGYVRFNAETNYVKTHISGSGKVDIGGLTNFMDTHISGSGNLNAFDMECKDVDSHISGSGNCEITATESLNADISGSGNIRYRGNPTVYANVSGSGTVMAAN